MLSNRKRRLGSPVAIVLGGGLFADGTPGRATVLRAETAAKLAKAHPRMTLILSGDGRTDLNRQTAKSEAWHMAQILARHNVSQKRVLIEDEARDTIGNAVLSVGRYLRGKKPRKVIIVTSPFHAQRALLVFRGVLGAAWDIEICVSETAEGDDRRLAAEPGGIDWTNRFFEDLDAGDFTQIVTKVLKVGKPYFRKIRWLTQSARNAA